MIKLAVLILLAFSIPSHAQQDEGSTEKIYTDLRSAELRFSFDMKAEIDKGNIPFLFESKNSIERWRLQKVIETRADAGDSIASFYMGVLTSEFGPMWNREKKTKSGNEQYEKAIGFYKKACTAGLSNSCWNVAEIYVNGFGQTTSGLAAAEWFYKAGVGYLANGERERALAALESIQKIDNKHLLGKKLDAQLQKGAPQ